MFNRSIQCTVSMAVILAVLDSSVFSEPASHLDNKWLCEPAPNPDMTYILRSNSHFVTLGVPFQTNELGFRDRPVFEKTAGVFWILCVGDSVTFGTVVKNEQTFPNVLEKMIQQMAPTGVTIDVVNAGISAYNARNIKGLLEHYIKPETRRGGLHLCRKQSRRQRVRWPRRSTRVIRSHDIPR